MSEQQGAVPPDKGPAKLAAFNAEATPMEKIPKTSLIADRDGGWTVVRSRNANKKIKIMNETVPSTVSANKKNLKTASATSKQDPPNEYKQVPRAKRTNAAAPRRIQKLHLKQLQQPS
jgi:hypothetical protein